MTLHLTEDQHGNLGGTLSYTAGVCDVGPETLQGSIAGTHVSLGQTPDEATITSLQFSIDASAQHLTGSYSDGNGTCASSGTMALTVQ